MEAKRPVQLYSVSESAHLLGVSPKTIWRLIYSGKLPIVRIRRRVLISEAALNEFAMNEQRINLSPHSTKLPCANKHRQYNGKHE
jgi:excisionase family DNA binding protein